MRALFHEAVRVAAMLLLMLAGSPAKADPALPEGVTATSLGDRIDHYDFHSATLNKPMAFVTVYPHGYRADGKPWPVLFFLHGLGRKETTLIDDPASRAQLLEQPYVIVLPRGENGWYFDSPFDPARHYAQYLDEVIALAGRVAHLSADRAQRAIGGWSASAITSSRYCA